MAQTESFGPVIVVTAQPDPLRRFETSVEPKSNINCWLVCKKTRKTKKRRTYGPNGVVRARYCRHRPT